jgi:ppGpp synthetase/RelA/SpoT-type nucleotidyltranferase
MVEYQPTQPNSYGVHKIISRIKAEEELWNKVVDEIFGLDSLVTRDKELRHLSYYVKDVFGVKIVVGNPEEVLKLHQELERLSWSSNELQAVGESSNPSMTGLSFVETKDYIRNVEKNSGWEAMKSVVTWGGRMFEVQVQPLSNFWREREHLTRESHAGFKSRREEIRLQVHPAFPFCPAHRVLQAAQPVVESACGFECIHDGKCIRTDTKRQPISHLFHTS